MKLVELSSKDRSILEKILTPYEKKLGTNFFAFGSRVNGKAKKYSDLDLAYEHLSLKQLSALKEELEQSDLSITIDLVDLHGVDFEFQELIRESMVPFPKF